MPSNAVPQNDVSAVVGYLLDKGYFNPSSPNLPQNITILAEANDANQSALSTAELVVTNIKDVGTAYGNGSPIYQIARILFNAGVSIPISCVAQAVAGGAVAKVITITPTGTASANGTIYLKIAGREVLDSGNYAINIVTGDTPTVICGKFRTAIAAVLGCPVLGSGTATFIATAKWSGLTSDDINIVVDLNGTSLGTTYAVVSTTSGSGTPSVATALANFANAWKTIVINSYGLVSATMTELEAYNGIPDPITPTGQYAGIVMRPMFAFSGTTLDDPTSITSAGVRPNNVTIVACPAPLSLGMPFEAAANAAVVFANIAQNTPQSDVLNSAYPDMPPPAATSIPSMTAYAFRQKCVTMGCSTVDYSGGRYIMKDFITTYNVTGEFPPFYRWVRDLNIHFNIKFGYHLLEQTTLVGKTIAKDTDVITAENVIKPKMWKSAVSAYFNDLVTRALIVDAPFSNKSLTCTISSTNPNRLDTLFSVKISGLARISATTVKGGFNFTN